MIHLILLFKILPLFGGLLGRYGVLQPHLFNQKSIVTQHKMERKMSLL